MSLGFYAPIGHDPQGPHKRDEIYIVHSGAGTMLINDERQEIQAGDAIFVPAGAVHRFEGFTSDFSTWVVFWGPEGGEAVRGERDGS